MTPVTIRATTLIALLAALSACPATVSEGEGEGEGEGGEGEGEGETGEGEGEGEGPPLFGLVLDPRTPSHALGEHGRVERIGDAARVVTALGEGAVVLGAADADVGTDVDLAIVDFHDDGGVSISRFPSPGDDALVDAAIASDGSVCALVAADDGLAVVRIDAAQQATRTALAHAHAPGSIAHLNEGCVAGFLADDGPLADFGARTPRVLRTSASGAVLWTVDISSNQTGNVALAVDQTGGIFVAGETVVGASAVGTNGNQVDAQLATAQGTFVLAFDADGGGRFGFALSRQSVLHGIAAASETELWLSLACAGEADLGPESEHRPCLAHVDLTAGTLHVAELGGGGPGMLRPMLQDGLVTLFGRASGSDLGARGVVIAVDDFGLNAEGLPIASTTAVASLPSTMSSSIQSLSSDGSVALVAVTGEAVLADGRLLSPATETLFVVDREQLLAGDAEPRPLPIPAAVEDVAVFAPDQSVSVDLTSPDLDPLLVEVAGFEFSASSTVRCALPNNGNDSRLVRVDDAGSRTSTLTLGGNSQVAARGADCVVLAGGAVSADNGTRELFRAQPAGNPPFFSAVAANDDDVVVVGFSGDSGLIAGGENIDFPDQGRFAFLIRVDALDNVLVRHFDDRDVLFVDDVALFDDGDAVFVGIAGPRAGGVGAGLITRVAPDGSERWRRVFSPGSRLSSVSIHDGVIYATGGVTNDMEAGPGALINVDGASAGYAIAVDGDGQVLKTWWAGRGARFVAVHADDVPRAIVLGSEIPVVGTTIGQPEEAEFLLDLDILPHVDVRRFSADQG
jgi:hypothetical protein